MVVKDLVNEYNDYGWLSTAENAQLKVKIDTFVNATNYDKLSLDEKKHLWKLFGGKQDYIDTITQAQNILAEHYGATDPLGTLASVTSNEGMPAFPNGLVSNGMKKVFKTVDAAKIESTKTKQSSETKQGLYQKLTKQFSKVWKNATYEEKFAAYEYTYSFSSYNEPLRGIEYGTSKYKGVGNIDFDNVKGKSEQRKNTEALTSLINKCETTEARVLRRGVDYHGMDIALGINMSDLQSGNLEKIKSILEGREWTDHAFSSCGADTGTGFTDKDIAMEIYAPKGTKGAYLEAVSYYGEDKGTSWDGKATPGYTPNYENELLLQRGTRYKIMGVTKEYGKLKLIMQIVSQDPYKLP